MDEQFKQHGTFSWCELTTANVEKARDFYTRLFGWDTEVMSTAGMTYTIIKAGGEGIGGFMAMPKGAKGMPAMWGVYVTVDDVDVTAQIAEQLGAKLLVPPTDVPSVGRFCVIRDPEGAVISAITYVEM